MARKKRDSGGGYNWMDTYGDMVTQLLTFFIMLFSMSSVNEEKWEILIRAFTKNPDASTAQIILVQEGEGEEVAPAVGVTSNISNKATDNELPTELSQLYEYIMSFVAENELDAS
ncbi:MAG: flagellar motor protein, partial [Oscillospiraceae bacterium]|nr:flagellar motor protein [Oscillospiraceae bacterium]